MAFEVLELVVLVEVELVVFEVVELVVFEEVELEVVFVELELVIFEESGHCPFIEESDRFNATVGAFLAGLELIPHGYGQAR